MRPASFFARQLIAAEVEIPQGGTGTLFINDKKVEEGNIETVTINLK